MRILQVHNFYQQAGGEDRVVAAEQALLSAHGHTVIQFTLRNDSVDLMSPLELAGKTVWNQVTYRNIRHLIERERVELVHVHNTLPLVSPAVYWASAAQRVPVVQTLHNYRQLCPAATFYRQGQPCELCLHKTLKLPAVTNRCYRASLPATAVLSAMLAAHHFCGTYQRKVNTYIALTEFARAKFCEGGLPAERIKLKPNFLAEDPGVGPGTGGYALFVGRLSEEKGVATLLDAWSECDQAPPLKIAGDGPMQSYVRERAAAIANVEYLGACDHTRVIELLKKAAFLVFPSRWYEGMPMVVLEAFACGAPVVAFGIGSMNDLILDGVNGIKLAYENHYALPEFLKNSGPFAKNVSHLRNGARAHFERNFTAATNYELLLNIYQQALNLSGSIS
jgi:glycosyltransferase involved in cell wall biosynthesis